MTTVNPVPQGYNTVNPYIMVKGVMDYANFLTHAFSGSVKSKTTSANGSILNVYMQIGSSMAMLAEVRGGFQPMPMSFYIYVPDVDAVYEQALEAGATSLHAPSDKFYGNRDCGVIDPRGTYWFIASMIEQLTEAEITQRITPKSRD